MERRETGATARERFEEIAEELAFGGVVQGRMMGMPCLKVGSKMFAGLYGDDMTFKLGGPDHGEALALPGARLFDPSGRRPMKEWVQVPVEHVSRWRDLAERALRYVAGRPA
jgi:hypothetical protein